MSFNDNFVYHSKQERKKEMHEYRSLIFPFGEAHQNAVSAILRQIIKEALPENEQMVIYITAKERFLTMENPNTEELLRWMNRTVLLMPEERAMIVSLIALDTELDNLSNFPTIEDMQTTNFSSLLCPCEREVTK